MCRPASAEKSKINIWSLTVFYFFLFCLTLFLLLSFNPNSNICLISDMCSIISLPLFFPPSDWTNQNLDVDLEACTPRSSFARTFRLVGAACTAVCYPKWLSPRVRRWQPPCVTLVMVARWWRRLLSRVDVWHWHSRERGAGCQASCRLSPNLLTPGENRTFTASAFVTAV